VVVKHHIPAEYDQLNTKDIQNSDDPTIYKHVRLGVFQQQIPLCKATTSFNWSILLILLLVQAITTLHPLERKKKTKPIPSLLQGNQFLVK